MTDSISTDRLQDATVFDTEGTPLGTVAQIYCDDDTSEPVFVTIQSDQSGTPETVIPLHQATEADGGLQVPFSKEFIADAPGIEADGVLTPEEEDRLMEYYTLDSAPAPEADSTAESAADNATDNESVLVRNEELEVGTERRSSGQARLRKRTTTATETVEVPVTREEIILEREPVDPESTEARAAEDGQDEVVVETHEEVPVVTKQVSAEKVSLDTATVQDTETVSETIRHDDVDVEREGSEERTDDQA